MSSAVEKRFIHVISDALCDINDTLGYEYFDTNKTAEIAEKLYLAGYAKMQKFLKEQRGITLNELDKEKFEYEKAKEKAYFGILDGLIIKTYKGDSFEEKFNNYLYYSGIEQCEWITNTTYDLYYQTLSNILSTNTSNTNMINFIGRFIKRKMKSTTQGIAKIQTKWKFFRNIQTLDEITIDEHLETFRELAAIAENYLKLLYGIKNNYSTDQEMERLEKTKFHDIWNDIKINTNFNLFIKPFPNTIYWNASKHAGITKKVSLKEIEFKSNDGTKALSYRDFISLVRELYASTLVLVKMNMIVRSNNKAFFDIANNLSNNLSNMPYF
jgi:hypothetical protein